MYIYSSAITMKRRIRGAARKVGEALRAKHIALAGLQAITPAEAETPHIQEDTSAARIEQSLVKGDKGKRSAEKVGIPHEGDPPEGIAPEKIDLGDGVHYFVEDGAPVIVVPEKKDDAAT